MGSATVGGVLVCLLLGLVPSSMAAASSLEPPLAGDWVIDGHERFEGVEVSAPGNVVVRAGGVLELVSATLIMSSPPPAEPILTIEAGGRVYLNGSQGRPSAIGDSGLDADDGTPLDFFWRLIVREGGLLRGEGCRLHDVGQTNTNANRVSPFSVEYAFLVEGELDLHGCQVTQATQASSNLRTTGTLRLASTSLELETDIVGGALWMDGVIGPLNIRGVVTADIRNHTGSIDVMPDAGPVEVRVDGFHLDSDLLRQSVSVAGAGSRLHLTGVAMRLCCSVAGAGSGATMVLEDGFRRGDRTTGNREGTLNAITGAHLVLLNMTVFDNRAADVYADETSTVDLVNSTVETLSGPGTFRVFGLVNVFVVDQRGAPQPGVAVTAFGVSQLEATTNDAGVAVLHLPFEEWHGIAVDNVGVTAYPRSWRITAAGDEFTLTNTAGSQDVQLVAQGDSRDTPGPGLASMMGALLSAWFTRRLLPNVGIRSDKSRLKSRLGRLSYVLSEVLRRLCSRSAAGAGDPRPWRGCPPAPRRRASHGY